jgi:hypothetical protein
MKIAAGGAKGEAEATTVTDSRQVAAVVNRFRAKYAGDVKKYYSKFDVAVAAKI